VFNPWCLEEDVYALMQTKVKTVCMCEGRSCTMGVVWVRAHVARVHHRGGWGGAPSFTSEHIIILEVGC
jgi:hypothetical protein